MGKTINKRRVYIKFALIGAVILFLVVAIFLVLNKWENSSGFFPEHEIGAEVVKYDGKDYVLKKNVETFLVLGLDKFKGASSADSYNNDKQADFLVLLVLDHNTKQYTAIHINRDSMVNVNVLGVAGNKVDTVFKQIALSHTYGNGKDVSCRNAADSVSSLLMGIKVNHYASLTMDAVAIVNDLVGGVEVLVTDDFTGIDDTLIKGERVVLKGTQALTYVRERKGLEDSTNSTRMQRQQQYIAGLYDAIKESKELDTDLVVEASAKLSDYIISDRSITQMQALTDKLAEYDFLGIENISGESVIGEEFIEFYPNEESIKEMVIKLFYTPKE